MATDTSKITGAADELSAGLAKGGTAAKTLGAEIANAIKLLDTRVTALESAEPVPVPPDPGPEPGPVTITRNVFLQPFGEKSIWNTPLGVGTGGLEVAGPGRSGGSIYKYKGNDGPIYEWAGGKTVMYTALDENLIVFGAASPVKEMRENSAGWNDNGQGAAAVRCAASTTATGVSVGIPPDAYYPGQIGSGDPCTNPGVSGRLPNCCSAILMPDRTKFVQNVPTQICSKGAAPTAGWFFPGTNNTGTSAPGKFVSIYADETSDPPAALGSHGGSGLSALGSVIRFNELIPGNCPWVPGVADVMRHTLSFSMNYNLFDPFGIQVWPATKHDRGNEALLMALLPSFDLNSLSTAPARSIAWTLMNYGAYLNDESGWDAIQLNVEYSYGDKSVNCPTGRVACQFKQVWGFTMDTPNPNPNTAWGRDIALICANFYVITNNTATSIGGPGAKRMQPWLVKATDPGVITAKPTVTAASLSAGTGMAVGQQVGQVTASQSPFWWSLSGTGADKFWIEPRTGVIYVSTVPAAGTYTLTATAQNIVGNGTGTVTIKVT
jgi:hypothetical protein